MLRRLWRRTGAGGNSFFALFFILSAFIFFILLTSFAGVSDYEEELLNDKIVELRENLDHLKHLDKEKSKAFIELQNQLKILISNRVGMTLSENLNNDNLDTNFNSNNQRSSNFGQNSIVSYANSTFPLSALKQFNSNFTTLNTALAQKFLLNFSLSQQQHDNMAAIVSGTSDLSVPNVYDYLPHLLQYPGGLTPAVKISVKNRRRVLLTIGVPTIKRTKISYLTTTLRSLIDNLPHENRHEVLIVVFLGDAGVTEFVTEQVVTINSEFSDVIESGLLEVLAPSAYYYPPDLDNLEPTFDDPPERMKWRAKQNLDYAYLMMYCQNRGTFYMQLEDDVITKNNYLQTIKDFISKQSSNPWYLLEFSSLGFIGKLFRARDLPPVVEFLLMFHREKPVDWLLDHIFYVRLCHPEKSNKQCQQTKNKYRIRYKPSLFQHIGVHSSLKGKVQKLKERDFGKQPLHKAHDNPPADVTTSLKTYQKYTVDGAYKGETFFWGLLPQPGDWIKFAFSPSIRLEGFTFRSGNAEHPDDIFYNTSIEILPSAEQSEDFLSVYPKTDDGYSVVAWFTPAGAVSSTLNTTGTVDALRLVVHTESSNWVILNEIWIRVLTTN